MITVEFIKESDIPTFAEFTNRVAFYSSTSLDVCPRKEYVDGYRIFRQYIFINDHWVAISAPVDEIVGKNFDEFITDVEIAVHNLFLFDTFYAVDF
jgi:hypothetical protein